MLAWGGAKKKSYIYQNPIWFVNLHRLFCSKRLLWYGRIKLSAKQSLLRLVSMLKKIQLFGLTNPKCPVSITKFSDKTKL